MKKLNIALVAHDARKKELVDWVRFNGKTLYPHHLIATGTTGKLLSEIIVNDLEEIRPLQKNCLLLRSFKCNSCSFWSSWRRSNDRRYDCTRTS